MPVSNLIVFLAGKTGCGKSFLLNYLLHREYELKRRGGIVVLDFRGDHLNLLKQPDFHYLRISGDILNNYNVDWAGVLQEYPYLIIEPHKLSREDYEQLSDDIARGLIEIGNRVYVIEEAQLAFPVYSSIRRYQSILITTGRKIGLDLYFTSQRPAMVNSVAISQANIRISFSVDDLNDIQRMKTYFNEVKLEELKRFQFVAKNTFNHQFCQGSTDNLKIIDKVIWGI